MGGGGGGSCVQISFLASTHISQSWNGSEGVFFVHYSPGTHPGWLNLCPGQRLLYA